MKIKLGDFLREICIKTVVNNEYPVLTSSKNGIYLQSEYFNKQVASKDNTGYKIIKKGQFTYRAMSDTGEFYPNMLKCVDIGIVSPAYPVFEITNRDIIYPQYLQYFFRSNTFRYNISGLEQGSTRTSIKFNKMKNIKIKLPSLLEQKKVIMILDRVGSLIFKRQEQLKYFDELTKSLFIEMFGDPVENPKKWNISTLLTLGSCKNGMNFHIDDFGVEINCIGVGDFKDYDVISNTHSLPIVSLNSMPTEDYLLKDEDIVFVRSNGNKTMVGRSIVIYPGKNLVTFSGFCIRYRNEDSSIMVPYLLRVLKTESIRMQMYGRGANIQNLNQKILASLKIPIPPMNLQEKFVQSVSSIDKSKLAVKKSLEELEILKKSLMQKYFA